VQKQGFSHPLFVREKTGLHMTVPDNTFSISDVSNGNIFLLLFIRNRKDQKLLTGSLSKSEMVKFSAAEPKLFVWAPAPDPTFKKSPLWLRLQLKLCGYLFSQLLNEKVFFS
jgi:hypothetical protein